MYVRLMSMYVCLAHNNVSVEPMYIPEPTPTCGNIHEVGVHILLNLTTMNVRSQPFIMDCMFRPLKTLNMYCSSLLIGRSHFTWFEAQILTQFWLYSTGQKF